MRCAPEESSSGAHVFFCLGRWGGVMGEMGVLGGPGGMRCGMGKREGRACGKDKAERN